MEGFKRYVDEKGRVRVKCTRPLKIGEFAKAIIDIMNSETYIDNNGVTRVIPKAPQNRFRK